MPASPVVAELVYPDVEAAVAWLSEAFGLGVRWVAGGHRAQLAVGSAAVAVMEPGEGYRTPGESGPTGGVLVRVEDADAHHERARSHGARIIRPPEDHSYGERQYTAADLAGHRWTFSQTIADVAPEDWGGTPGPAAG
jgi:uncharacterized glyoxalase superfamily protein PhnB